MLLSILNNLTESRTLWMNSLMRTGCLCESLPLNLDIISLLSPLIGFSILPTCFFPSFPSLQSLHLTPSVPVPLKPHLQPWCLFHFPIIGRFMCHSLISPSYFDYLWIIARFSFTDNIHLQVSTFHVCLLRSWLPHPRWIFLVLSIFPQFHDVIF